MRAVVFVALVALALLAAFTGRWAIALGVAALKSLLVAAEYMELRLAHRAHGAAFGLCVVALSLSLWILASPR